jgi:hypothetical protein
MEQKICEPTGNNSFFTFLVLPDHFNPKNLIDRFPAFVDRRMDHKIYNENLPSNIPNWGCKN